MEKELLILKALAHPVRLSIIYSLDQCDSKCVCKIQEDYKDITQSNLSQHLKVLREADLVITEKDGAWVNYRLKNKNIINVLKSIKEI